MYQKYQTESLVLGSRESGEADKVYVLYTKDFGLMRARATAVRSEKSRMRYALQNYSRAVAAFARISELVLRLVNGEEKNDYLFAALAEAHGALMREKCEAFGTI